MAKVDRATESLPFLKVEAAGNDFVLLDLRTEPGPRLTPPAVRYLLDRHRGIGGDGLLILRDSPQGEVVEFRNPDGNPADFCGNGARCVAAHLLGEGNGPILFRLMKIAVEARRTESGIAVRSGGAQALAMPDLSRLRPRPAALIHAGVDHWIVPVGDVGSLDLLGLGSALRSHPWPTEKGANVTFVERRRTEIRIRTYERGVEGETLSCGSGAIAAAHWALGDERGPMSVLTRGGDLMQVWRDESGSYWLAGPNRVVFSGVWPLTSKGAGPATRSKAGRKES